MHHRHGSTLRRLGEFAALALLLACAAPNAAVSGRGNDPSSRTPSAAALGRLNSRVVGAGHGGTAGLRPLAAEHSRDGLLLVPEHSRDGLLLVPASYRPDRPAPLIVMLHGAGGRAEGGMRPFAAQAERAGAILYAPQSSAATWDFIGGPFGADRASLDATLRRLFSEYNVDPARVGIAGFSDGASYALTIGLSNGDLFTRIVAFSPGMGIVLEAHGMPAVFISHGTRDEVLAIDRTSRQIVPRLQAQGYAVEYHEFDGRHGVPDSLARRAFMLLVAP